LCLVAEKTEVERKKQVVKITRNNKLLYIKLFVKAISLSPQIIKRVLYTCS